MSALTWSETPEGRWPQILELARMSESDEALVEDLVKRHANARSSRNFLMADQIRDEMLGQGVIITGNGWEPARWRALAGKSVFGGGFQLDLRGCLRGSLREALAPALSEPPTRMEMKR